MEKVFVIEEYWIGSKINKDNVLKALQFGCFYNRKEVETLEYLKQIIPYVTIIRNDGKILSYKRSKKAGENRLHNKWSIGFGGHVNPIDLPNGAKNADDFLKAINREVNEELDWGNKLIEDGYTIELQDVIYDSSNEVGRVHIGLSFYLLLHKNYKDNIPIIGDKEVSEIKWVTRKEALELENLEGWSKMVLKEK